MWGDDCEWYTSNTDSCGAYDDSDFEAAEACCACGRGSGSPTYDDDCVDNLSVSDAYGDDCSWYSNNVDSCGAYDDSDFEAAEACCACRENTYDEPTYPDYDDYDYDYDYQCQDDNSTTDAYGDDCEWYSSNTDSCGDYDDSDFSAADACCACGGGLGYGGGGSSSSGECVDDATAVDSYGDGCDYYSDYPSECGYYDTDFFTASVSCCACAAR